MNLRNITLKYMGWCPGIKAAARFIPDKEIPDKRVKQIYVLIVVAALGFSIPYLLLLESKPSPAWITADRIEPKIPPETFIEVEKQELSKFPKLAIVIEEADADFRLDQKLGRKSTPSGLMLKMSHDEGRTIITFLGGEYKKTVKTYFFKVWLNGNLYRIHIQFSEKPPTLA